MNTKYMLKHIIAYVGSANQIARYEQPNNEKKKNRIQFSIFEKK